MPIDDTAHNASRCSSALGDRLKQQVSINGRAIGEGCPPYVIAELSANHNGDLDKALALIRRAKAAGVDAVKIQSYRPDTMTIDCQKNDFQLTEGLWAGKNLYQLYEWAHTPWDWHETLFKTAKDLDITLFSSPFDKSAVDLLEDLNAPAYKIASFEVVDLPLIRYAASTCKPMIISTGMANDDEIQAAVDAARSSGCDELVLLHCVSGYPAPASDYNLRTIPDMQQRFGLPIGLSDHTLDNTTPITAVALGACVIEKHFTLDRNGGGPDDSFSLEPSELEALCQGANTAWSALGAADYTPKSSEKSYLVYRRSLYVVKDVQKGEVFTDDNVRSIRPGFGLAPDCIDAVLGKTASMPIEAGTRMAWDLVT